MFRDSEGGSVVVDCCWGSISEMHGSLTDKQTAT